jgi:hypothetical protein
VSAVTATIQA